MAPRGVSGLTLPRLRARPITSTKQEHQHRSRLVTKQAVDVAGTGFTVLDRVYADDSDPFEALGGSCGNVLVSLALLNRSVAPVIALGCDDVGDALSVEFQLAGADTRYIFRSHYIASPILIQLVDTLQGQHEFSFV